LDGSRFNSTYCHVLETLLILLLQSNHIYLKETRTNKIKFVTKIFKNNLFQNLSKKNKVKNMSGNVKGWPFEPLDTILGGPSDGPGPGNPD